MNVTAKKCHWQYLKNVDWQYPYLSKQYLCLSHITLYLLVSILPVKLQIGTVWPDRNLALFSAPLRVKPYKSKDWDYCSCVFLCVGGLSKLQYYYNGNIMDSKCDYDNPHLRLVFFRASRHLFKTGQNGGTHSNSCTLEDAFESEKDFQTSNLLKPVYSWYSFEKSLN